MFAQNIIRRLFGRHRRGDVSTIDPDEVLLDAFNLPAFDTDQFEGRVAQPITRSASIAIGVFFILISVGFLYRTWDLQIVQGAKFSMLSERNSLEHVLLFAERGVVYDRTGRELVWNMPGEDVPKRVYTKQSGLSHVLGFVGYPQKDASGNWWRKEYVGKSGVERSFDDLLAGENGLQISEVDAAGNEQSKNLLRKAIPGRNITLSIDSKLQEAMNNAIKESTINAGYVGGAGVVVDVNTGEVIVLTSYPEFSSSVMSDGEDAKLIQSYAKSIGKPFLNRTISATYAPGSIVKPYVAAAALAEGLISQWKQIYSSGVLVIPNPYNPALPSRFLDWKAHGAVDMRRALAVSSNIYFYALGGGLTADLGLGVQKGLGIDKLAAYAQRFGFGEKTGIALWGEKEGNVPTRGWKKNTFGEDWLLGNTYHSSIGQYGWLVTPLQVAMYTAALANGGNLLSPQILRDSPVQRRTVGIEDKNLQIVREGMRLAVTEGTLTALNYGDMRIAAKTGTAQVGKNNEFKNSWVIGFWPNEKPQFAFVLVLERAPSYATYGAVNASINFFNSLRQNLPEYAKGNYPEIDI